MVVRERERVRGGENCSFFFVLLLPKSHTNFSKMYVIAVYDVDSKRCSKMLKLCRQYLHWVQNSVFEGEISQARLMKLIHEAKQIMDEQSDSFIIFKNRDKHWLKKQIIGVERSNIDQFL